MIPIRPAIHILNVVLLTVLAYTGVKTVYDISVRKLPTPVQRPADAAAIQTESGAAKNPLPYYQVISRRNLFGAGADTKTSPPPAAALQNLEPTKLKLKLWGTITHRGGKEYAVIETLKDRNQDLYKAGDTVEGALVKQVLREKIVLTVAGRDEILQMAESVISAPSATPGAASAPPLESAGLEPQHQQVPISREDVRKASENIQELMRQVRIRPHFEQGKPAGLMLSGVQPESLFTRMGLQSGDVLRSIDGSPIRSMNDVLKLYEQLGSADALEIEVKRGGSLLNIQYGIE
ncbi:MAG: type II secretion system protein GspC [Pseudomonadota bacterium]